jgi:hypothetical protein
LILAQTLGKPSLANDGTYPFNGHRDTPDREYTALFSGGFPVIFPEREKYKSEPVAFGATFPIGNIAAAAPVRAADIRRAGVAGYRTQFRVRLGAAGDRAWRIQRAPKAS